MRISDILANKQTFSFEIFPPKGEMSVEQAASVTDELSRFSPDWISVTFSAGGTGNSQNTLRIAKQIEAAGKTSTLAHLTCLGSSKADVDAYVDTLRSAGGQNILALRGDRAPGRDAIDFSYASDLVAYLKQTAPDICVGGACYPEGHLETDSLEQDIENLKRKQDAGVDFLVTQLFFNNEDFYRFRERCARHRIKVPIVVGIMPFTSTKQIQRMAFSCGTSIPVKVIKRLAAAGDDTEAQRQAGIEYACEQLEDLATNGVDGLHIYSMNKPQIAADTHACLARAGFVPSN